MGKTLGQVVLLFVFATVVSIGLIQLFKSELERSENSEKSSGRSLSLDKGNLIKDESQESGGGLVNEFSSGVRASVSLFYTRFKSGLSRLNQLSGSGTSRDKRSTEERIRHRHNGGKEKSNNGPEDCYGTGELLVVVGITCLLNFGFVFLIWASVRCINRKKRKKVIYSSEEEESDGEEDNQQIIKSVRFHSMENLKFCYNK